MYITKNTTQKEIKEEIIKIENALKEACLIRNPLNRHNAISIFNNELDYLYSFLSYDDFEDDFEIENENDFEDDFEIFEDFEDDFEIE